MTDPQVWALTTGEAGMRAQALGLARAVSSRVEEKTVGLKGLWRWAPSPLAPLTLWGLDPAKDNLSPPWPDLLVTCGRRAGLIAVAVRRASRGRTLTVHVQDPLLAADRFDLIVAMGHDPIQGPNVFRVRTALHAVTPARLAEGAQAWRERFSALPRPLAGVLLGGTTRRRPFTAAQAQDLAQGLAQLARGGWGLAITPSRRTPPEVTAAIRAAVEPLGGWVWDGSGDNPYFGIMGLADRVIVTADSFSMVSEALATGAPVDIYDFGGGGRQQRFIAGLFESGLARPFRGDTDTAPGQPPLDATVEAAAAVRDLLAQRRG